VARASDEPQMPDLYDDEGRPVFVRLFGSGMTLIVEARRGNRGPAVGRSAYDEEGGAPDMQMLVSRALGNGSPAVCDYNRLESCTGVNGIFGPVNPESEVQYCLPIASKWAFPVGDTIVAVRVRDERDALSEPMEIVIRVLQSEDASCVGLGERSITLARPASQFFSSAAGEDDASLDPWLEGPIRICAGPDIGGGIHPLSLRADAVFGFQVLDGSALCVKLAAFGSEGSLDCNGGTPADVLVTQDLPDGPVLQSGLGVDAGTGAATLSLPVAIVALPAGSSAAECTTTSFGGAFRTVLTTATASAVVTNTSQGGDASIEATGTNFDCEAWTTTDGPGTFVFAFPATQTVVGVTATAIVLAD
jgi:hypothetical protein